jgi:hypothetical protein
MWLLLMLLRWDMFHDFTWQLCYDFEKFVVMFCILMVTFIELSLTARNPKMADSDCNCITLIHYYVWYAVGNVDPRGIPFQPLKAATI